MKTGELLLTLAGKHSIVVIEHDMTFVRQIARKVTVLHQGSVLCEGTFDEVQKMKKVIEVYLGRKKKDKKLNNGIPLRFFFCLKLTNIGGLLRGLAELRGVTLTVPERGVICLLGRNGVGKTTTLRPSWVWFGWNAGATSVATGLDGLKPAERARCGLGRGGTDLPTI